MDKKISFGFNKSNKKTPILQNRPSEKEKVELIDCLEGHSIKIKNAPTVVTTPLIIPVKEDRKDLLDRIIKVKQKESPRSLELEDNRPDSELTIDELAARELINDAKKRLSNNVSSNNHLILPSKGNENSNEDEREPTLDDYEKIPVTDFGMAMLRGMGWKEGIGIGKNPSKFEPAKPPELRPKGLGLGASKMIQSEIPLNPVCDKDGNALIIKKGSYAKIIAGSHKGEYCEVQGLDDEAGRVIVKTSLQAKVLTVNEILIVPVTKDEYVKKSKVLNNDKYEEYKKISDKNLENYHKSRSRKSQEEIKQESTSDSNHGSVRVNDKSDIHNKKDSHVSKSGEKSSNYRDRRSEDSSSEDSDNVNKRGGKKDSDNRERNKYTKEKSSYSRSSPDYQEKSSRNSKSRSRHNRSRSRESDKYNRTSRR